MIDFRKLVNSKGDSKITNPIELYNTLDRKSIAGPLRRVQEQVLKEWYENRVNEKDVIVKLHTGEGKTLIGLLILQSALNRGEGPCIYVCPNIYLVGQVCEEAEKFGIPICKTGDNTDLPYEFISCDKILVTHVHKVFNGRSKFGTGNSCVQLGTIVLDDSHVCIDVIKNSFKVFISKEKHGSIYNKVLELFADDLSEQGLGSFLEIESGQNDTYMMVPYWAWNNKKQELLSILAENISIDEINYPWPLMKDRIIEYSCIISGSGIEISPYSANVEVFGSFANAKRRVLMSATTQEDAFFIKGLNFSIDAVKQPIQYSDLKWSGEKMMLIPSLVSESCDRDTVATFFGKLDAKNTGVVTIVPNTRRAQYYRNLGATVPSNNDELIGAIKRLRRKEYGKTVVINNRYDGIDLPDESCRVLILDSMPFLSSYSERHEEKCCPNSEVINKKLAQKIEQGMGRAVRGEKDYCAVIIIGPDIEKFIRGVHTRKYFSAQTQKQVEIGLKVSEIVKDELKDHGCMEVISSLIKQMLVRDEGWKDYYNSEMSQIVCIVSENSLYDRYTKEKELEKLFSQGEYRKAVEKTQDFINRYIDNDLEKGWYLEQMARYSYYLNSKEKFEELQKSAFKKNPQLLKPRGDVSYSKISYMNENRINRIRSYINEKGDNEQFCLQINELLERLSFGVSSDKFECALQELGEVLGYVSQRPDQEIRKGPDNLWCVLDKAYLFFECKNEVKEGRRTITKTEAGQFNNHCAWFKKEYGQDVQVLRVIVIQTRYLAYNADISDEAYTLSTPGLNKLKKNLKGFVQEMTKYEFNSMSDEKIQSLLDLYHLNYKDFQLEYLNKIEHENV